MRRYAPVIIAAFILAFLALTLIWLYSKSKPEPKKFEISQPAIRNIIKKSVATGQLIPREEIEVKARVSGVASDIKVEPGDKVEKDALLATIQIVPNVVSLNEAEARVASARIAADNAKRELERHQKLFAQKVISQAEVARYRVESRLRSQELRAAKNNLTLVRKGSLGRSKKSTNQVRATVGGKVLEVPVKNGTSVIESNAFNPGTTVAVIADMEKIIFEGKVDEAEVGKLKVGMDLLIKVGALEGVTLKGTLEHIAPKGVPEQGTMQFVVKAKVTVPKDIEIRAGYSATADIVLAEREKTLAVEERVLIFDGDKRFVEVQMPNKRFEKREVELGLSDGIYIEVKRGVAEGDQLKVQTELKS